jgi:tRNA U54 and U55 pseudouridine synthase Pus10
MAIQPIDLQTLFTQIDKVGKEQMNQKEGVQIQAALQGVQIQKKTDERDHSVNETRDAGEGAEQIKDRNARQGGGYPSGRQAGGKDPDESGDRESPFIRDPALGKNIDISG